MRQIPEKIDSKFRFVLLAATRAEQLMRGAQPKVQRPDVKPTRVALEEIFEEAVGWEYGPEVVEEALADDSGESAEGEAEPTPAT